MLDLPDARRRMVDRQLRARGVTDGRVLDAMQSVPREAFVPRGLAEFAYEDSPLPIEAGQTISQPYIVAYMIEAAEVKPGDRVLEVGAGSGYAAAVIAAIADRVYTIERHAELALSARERLLALGCANVEVRIGDGSAGWPDGAPFDAILVAAASPVAPDVLKEQLAIGGRLIVPVGGRRRSQRLVKVTRASADAFEQAELAEVAFVPLIGAHGWPEQESGEGMTSPRLETALRKLVREAAEELPDFDDPAFGTMFGRFASARVVLLGEATEGTSEFQRARAAITRRLIVAHGFNILAVDMDWQDAAAIDRFVGGAHYRDDAADALPRGANWKCMNAEFAAFAAWLRRYNDAAPAQRHAGFYGLDRYNSDRALHAAAHYLNGIDPDAAALARMRHGELASSINEPARRVHTPRRAEAPHCAAVAAMLSDLLDEDLDASLRGSRDYLDTLQRQGLAGRADAYYRAMYKCSPSFWNMREQHMFETLMQLLGWKGPDAKAVVWAHNAHVGDGRYTEMGWLHDEINLGQLCREWFGDNARLIGFGANAGTVAAADDWDGPMKTTQVAPAPDSTYERLMHGSGVRRFLVDLRRGVDDRLRAALDPPRLERFIGHVYRPDADDRLHYASASLPYQFDAYVWFDASRAVRALPERGDTETMRSFGSQANAR